MKHIVIFLPNGKTLMFENVERLVCTEKEIGFVYFGKSTQQKKGAKFYTSQIAGWSASEDLLK